jgi:hypothetical protein
VLTLIPVISADEWNHWPAGQCVLFWIKFLAMRTDKEIEEDVLAQLMWEPTLKDAEISVSVQHGIVTLTGQVDSYYQKTAAVEAIKVLSGVRAIADDLRVGVPGEDGRSDTTIAEEGPLR